MVDWFSIEIGPLCSLVVLDQRFWWKIERLSNQVQCPEWVNNGAEFFCWLANIVAVQPIFILDALYYHFCLIHIVRKKCFFVCNGKKSILLLVSLSIKCYSNTHLKRAFVYRVYCVIEYRDFKTKNKFLDPNSKVRNASFRTVLQINCDKMSSGVVPGFITHYIPPCRTLIDPYSANLLQ